MRLVLSIPLLIYPYDLNLPSSSLIIYLSKEKEEVIISPIIMTFYIVRLGVAGLGVVMRDLAGKAIGSLFE